MSGTSTGYSYTTITSRIGEPTRIGVSFYLNEESFIELCGAGTDDPFLSVAHGDVTVRIGPRRQALTGADAVIARKLAGLAAQYAAEIERAARQAAGGAAAA